MITRRRHIDRRSGLAAAIMAGALAGAFPAWSQTSQTTTSNDIESSVDQTQGIVDINQQAGDANNQGNVTSIAVTTDANNSAALAGVIASQDNLATSPDALSSGGTNTINNSFNGSSGIVQVNQVAGAHNDQLNIAALAFAPGANFSPVLTDIELKQIKTPGAVSGVPSYAGDENSINNSFDNFQGIAQVQQVAGDGNLVTNVVAIAIGGGG
jgi:hypothetical protein